MRRWVRAVVRVCQVGSLAAWGPGFPVKLPGGTSGGTTSRRPKSTLSARILGGVPVLNRLRVWPTALRLWERKRAGGSPWRPAGRLFLPYQTTPERKVPPATTTALAGRVRPSTVRTPRSLPPSTQRAATSPRSTSTGLSARISWALRA